MTQATRAAWIDITVRPVQEPEVTAQPNGDIEVSWNVAELEGARITLIVPNESAMNLADQIKETLATTATLADLIPIPSAPPW